MENRWSSALLLFLVALGPLKALKIWQPSSDLEDPMNWGPEGFPGVCDRLILSRIEDVTVQLPVSHEVNVKSVILPREGILKFPSMSSLKLSGSEKCREKVGKDAWFTRRVKGWLDPQNWNNTWEGGWAPHRDRVPCSGEDVVFPNRSSLSVVLPSVLVPIRSISVKGRAMIPEEWSEFLQSEEGFESFEGSADLRDLVWRSDKGATDRGSLCGMNAYTIRDWSYGKVDPKLFDEAVCLYAKPRCESTEVPQCYDPVYPEGHCCGVCGSIIDVRGEHKDNEARIPLIKSIVSSVLRASGSNLRYYVGLRLNGDIQIVLVSRDGDPSESFTAARAISDKLKQGELKLAVGLSYSGFSKGSDTSSPTVGIFFGTLVAVLSFFASIYYVYMVLPKQKWDRLTRRDPFTFARFQNTLQEAVSQETLVLDTERPTAESFANPLYDPDGAPASDKPPSPGKENATPMQQPQTSADTAQLLFLDEPRPKEKAEDEVQLTESEDGGSDQEGESAFSPLQQKTPDEL